MAQIEKGLHEFHAAYLESPQDNASEVGTSVPVRVSQSSEQSANRPSTLPERVFARVNSVVASSPADTAGLKAGDGIVRFGEVDFMNHANLTRVSTVVQSNQGVGDTSILSAFLMSMVERNHREGAPSEENRRRC